MTGPGGSVAFCQRPGAIKDGSSGAVATDSYHRWQEDVASLAALRVTHYRFSVAWPRVQPNGKGPANSTGLDHYDRLTDALLNAGIVSSLGGYPALYLSVAVITVLGLVFVWKIRSVP